MLGKQVHIRLLLRRARLKSGLLRHSRGSNQRNGCRQSLQSLMRNGLRSNAHRRRNDRLRPSGLRHRVRLRHVAQRLAQQKALAC